MTKRILLIVALSAVPVLAADPWKFTVEPRAQYLFDTDAGDLSLSTFRSGAVLTSNYKLSEAATVGLRSEGEYSQYDFDGLGDDSPSDFVRGELRPTASLFFSPKFGVFAGGYIAAGAQVGADFSNALTYGGFAGVNYKIAENVWIGAGLGFVTELEDSASFYPLINAYWQITPELLLTADGLGGRLSYACDDHWTVFFDGRYEFREFRLDDNAVVPGGALRDTGLPLSIGVKYAVDDTFSVTVAGGAVVYRTIRLSTAGGTDLIDETADAAAFGAASLSWSF